MVLGWNNARLVCSDGRYNIVPADQALAGNARAAHRLARQRARLRGARGAAAVTSPPSEMEKLLKPYARPNAIVRSTTRAT